MGSSSPIDRRVQSIVTIQALSAAYASQGIKRTAGSHPSEAYAADKAEYLARCFGWRTLAIRGMPQGSRQAAGDSFLGMAPCGPLYSRGKSLRRPASNSGFAKSVFLLIGHSLSDQI